MIFYLLQIVVSLFAFYHYRNNRIRYLAVITTMYFAVYFMDGGFDIALSIYFVMIFLGIGKPTKIDMGSFWLIVWILAYTIVGVVFQNIFTTLSTLITRYGYILVFGCMVLEKGSENAWYAKAEDYRFVVRLGLFTEIALIALVWMRDGFGARIVTNHQPIGAGMVIALTIVTGWCYLNRCFSAAETVCYSIFFIIITILSGTRGYMVVIGLTLMVIMISYLLDVPDNGQKMLIRIGICCFGAAAVIVWLFVLNRGKMIGDFLRLDESLGYRENENVFVRELFLREPWYNKIFGFGFGGNASHVEGLLEAAQKASWNRPYMFEKLQSRTIFHNYWYTVLFKQGIMGLIVIVVFYVTMIKSIFDMNEKKWKRCLLLMFVVGSVISLTFRITATCSVFEMCMIAFFIRQTENRQEDAGLPSDKNLEAYGKREY